MVFITTALGRTVPLRDERLQDEDRILKPLYDLRIGPFNPDNSPLDAQRLARIAKLTPAEFQDACDRLVAKRLIEPIGDSAGAVQYRITDDGLDFVGNLPQAP